jgi:single-strand DNA-binding protein
MAGTNINRVIITGNLTRDPELRSTGSGLAVCGLRIATNTRRKDGATGEWVDKANYFDVTIFGRQGENAAQYLSKGRPVAIDGRLEWREFTDQQGNKRQAVDIIADNVQFLGGPGEGGGGGGSFTPRSDVPVSTDDFAPAPVGAPNGGGGGGGGNYGGSSTAADDDIPF